MALFLASCTEAHVGCGLGEHAAELGSGIYTGGEQLSLLGQVEAGTPAVCRVRIPF